MQPHRSAANLSSVLALAALLGALGAGTASAQVRADARVAASWPLTVAVAQEQRTGASALGIEVAGGIIGSAIGVGSVLLLSDPDGCGENLTCILGKAASAVMLGTVGAATGSYVAGRMANTRPSGLGAALGAAVGAVAAVGVEHLVSDEMDINVGQGVRVLLFAATQGTFSGLGSRLRIRLR